MMWQKTLEIFDSSMSNRENNYFPHEGFSDFFFFFFFFFVFLGPCLRHMEVPRLGVKLEL